jgi:hypothetical protein
MFGFLEHRFGVLCDGFGWAAEASVDGSGTVAITGCRK